MVTKRPYSVQQKTNQQFGNGLDSNGIHNSRRSFVNGKRANKHPQQLFMNENDYKQRLQEILYSPEYIFTKIFRKDGPSLGDRFDAPPANAFSCYPGKSHHEENQLVRKKRKVSKHTILDYETCCENSSHAQKHGIGKGPMTANGAPILKHGMGKGLMSRKGGHPETQGTGKGLMTVWRSMSNARGFPYDAKCSENPIQKKKSQAQPRESIAKKLAKKEQAKRKTSHRSRKVECQKVIKPKQPPKVKCVLALEDVNCVQNVDQFAMLLDDEELELRELQAGPNPLSCSTHFPVNGSRGCSLCKDLLAKFPPNSVTMKLPLSMAPWASSPDLVNKLFKVFHFLCTYAVTISIYSFTLDEFAQAFHDKDSLLLGQVHVALLKLLLSDVGKELSGGIFFHASKNCKFLGLLHSLEQQGSVLDIWQKSLNLLTWTEILRQVLVASGFGSKLGMPRKTAHNKEVNLMDKYGLTPGTLKGELFNILSTRGNSGMEVSELAKSSSVSLLFLSFVANIQLNNVNYREFLDINGLNLVKNTSFFLKVVDLSLTDASHDLENIITSVLSGDITLFEKISLSRYRLRIHAVEKECKDCPSDSEDDISEVTGVNEANDSEYESRGFSPSGIEISESDTNMLRVYNEIDESHPDVWLLGLMEGEYSDLSIEEKLSALAALIDLLGAGSSIRMEEPSTSSAECPSNSNHHGSGAKIKRSMTKQCNSLGQGCGQQISGLDANKPEQPIDSLLPMSKIDEEEKYAKKITNLIKTEEYLHSMQSIYLGSDRRYNRYWLFLGPCDEFDPGHRRIYFESSEDGHWEVIDTEEALNSLLSALDRRGVREAHLLASLEKREATLRQAMCITPDDGGNRQQPFLDPELNNPREDSSSPVSDVDNQLSLSQLNELNSSTGVAICEARRQEHHAEKFGHSQAFDAWIWKSFYSELNTVKNGKKIYLDSLRKCDQCQDLYWREEKHCRICHTTFELDFDLEERYAVHSAVCRTNSNVNKCRRQRGLSSQLQALKAATYAIESAIPEDALLGSWKRSAHKLWVNRLRRASTIREFSQVLADFVAAVNEDWFYERTNSGSDCTSDVIFWNFSTVPQTYSAFALYLEKLDLLVASHAKSGHSSNNLEIIARLDVR